MEQTHTQFLGSVPEHYHRHLGPVLFEPYARHLAARLPSPPPRRVLELACGTGISTRALREALPPSTTFVATDLNEAMLEFGRSRPDAPGGVEWRVADMTALPFGDGEFELVACQFGLMFVPDKPRALHEVRRVLVPGGTFLFDVWDSIERNRVQWLGNEVMKELFPDDPPNFYEVPFTMHDTREIDRLLSDAGFDRIVIEHVSVTSQHPSAGELARGVVEGNPLAITIRARNTVPIERVVEVLAGRIASVLGDQPVRAEMHAFLISARAPRG